MDMATIRCNGEDLITLPIVAGTEGERAIDIGRLRQTTGLVALDPGYGNTAETESSVTFIDGEQGILRYRGYPVGQLVGQSSFLEVAYLLDRGELPSRDELAAYQTEIDANSSLPDGFPALFEALPAGAHPMQKIAVSAALLGAHYPGTGGRSDMEASRQGANHLIAKLPIVAAWAYRSSTDRTYIEPRPELGYVANFLNMMFNPGKAGFVLNPTRVEAVEELLILHADHGQNLSTSAVRLVGSGQTDLFSAICAGILALSGPLHGGANQRVVEMLEDIQAVGGDTTQFLARAKDRNDPFRLMGFGHRVYRNFDPRADLIKRHARGLLDDQSDPLLDIALRLEKEALADDYFIDRRIYPNVDYYSGIIYRAIGFPSDMFTVLFALGRLPGWLAQWREMMESPDARIKRPRQIYTGYREREYVPIAQR